MKVKPNFYFFEEYFYVYLLCAYMYVCTHVAWCVCRAWDQTSAGGSGDQPQALRVSSESLQVWLYAPLPPETSCWPQVWILKS